jgi:hypothetical protein
MIQFSEGYNAQTIFDQVWEAPYEWFALNNPKVHTLPTWVNELDDMGAWCSTEHITVEMIEKATIEFYMVYVSKRTGSWARTMANYLEDLDADDVDAILQLAMFGEIRYG